MSKQLNDFIRGMMAIPYKHRGRGYDGADCGGAIIIFYRDFRGITLPDFDVEYDENWAVRSDKSHFLENYYKLFDKVERPALFDMVLFQTKRGIAHHGGVVLRNGRFFHISKTGASINRYSEEPFLERLNGFYHYKTS